MQLHNLKRKNENKKSVSVGRGGKRGKTSGRGTKGQGARAGRKIRPEIRDMIKRIPKLRGRGKNSNLSIETKPLTISLSAIEKAYEAGNTVNPQTLIEKNIVSLYKGRIPKVKILAPKKDEAFSKKLSFENVLLSASVKALVEKAGGEVKNS